MERRAFIKAFGAILVVTASFTAVSVIPKRIIAESYKKDAGGGGGCGNKESCTKEKGCPTKAKTCPLTKECTPKKENCTKKDKECTEKNMSCGKEKYCSWHCIGNRVCKKMKDCAPKAKSSCNPNLEACKLKIYCDYRCTDYDCQTCKACPANYEAACRPQNEDTCPGCKDYYSGERQVYRNQNINEHDQGLKSSGRDMGKKFSKYLKNGLARQDKLAEKEKQQEDYTKWRPHKDEVI